GGADLLVDGPGLRDQVVEVLDRVEGHVAGDGAGHVPRRDVADTGEAEVDQAVLEIAGDGRVALGPEVDVAFRLALVLGPVGIVQTEVEVGYEAVHGQRGGELERGQLILDARRLAVAGTVDGAGEVQGLGVGVVATRNQLGKAGGADVEFDAVELRLRQQLGVVLQAQFVARGARPADIGDHPGGAHAEIVVPAEGFDLVLAAVVHAAHQRVDVVGGAAGEGVAGVDARIGDVQPVEAAVVIADVDLELVRGIDLLGLGIEQVQGAGPGVGRAVLQGRHHAVALQLAGTAQRLDAVGVVGAFGNARTPVVADRLPGLVQTHLVLLDGRVRMRPADRQADRAVGELVDVAGVEAAAVVADVGGRAQRAFLVAAADGDHGVGEV